MRKAEREREKRDALDKANSSAHSDGSLKSGSIRAHRSKRSAKVSFRFFIKSLSLSRVCVLYLKARLEQGFILVNSTG